MAVDAIRLVEKIMVKAYEFKVDLELMFVDFLRVFDSIKRNKLVSAWVEMNLGRKLIRLIKMTMKLIAI